jgi:NAD+ synthetase
MGLSARPVASLSAAMKIAIAQISTATGDVEANLRKVKDAIGGAAEAGASLVAFPEFALTGWMPMDLLRERPFEARCESALAEVARAATGFAVVLGHVARDSAGRLVSAAIVCAEGRRVAAFAGPPLDSRDPWREGSESCACALGHVDLGAERVAVLPAGVPLGSVPRDGARTVSLLVSLSAGAFWPGCRPERRRVVSDAARRLGVPVALANLVGGNGQLVFDGGSLAVNARGRMMAAAAQFREDLLVVDPEGRAAGRSREPGEVEQLREALKLGVADYVRKSGFRDVVLGLSGGVDSAVVAAIAADALGPERVTALGMPSVYSSEATRESARAVASNLGVRYHVVSIEDLRSAFDRALDPLFRGTARGAAEENVQARIRGTLLMAYANKFGALALATGNRSEVATGYCTLYGDTAGGLAPIGDVPKTVVYELAAHINRETQVIPQRVFELAPSAELKPNQTDQDDLPSYDVLDRILALHLDEGLDAGQVIERGFDPGTVKDVVARVKRADFKRRQMPPALWVYSRGSPWPRLPLAASFEGPAA